MASSRGSLRRALIVPAVAVVVLAITHAWWMAALGRFLVDAEPPTKADMIVVIAGGWTGGRILKGAELVREGYADKALVSGPLAYYGMREYDLAIPYAERHGYPKSYFVPVAIDATSTRQEAVELAAELRRRGVHRVLLVTSDYHTRRVRWMFHIAAPDLDVHVAAAPDTLFNANHWWEEREWRKTFFYEWTKLITSAFGM